MGRSKNLHIVQLDVEIEQPNDPQMNWAEGVIQVDQILSQELGRTIRNGNSFRLVGFGASLKGFNTSGDVDTGFAGVAAVQFCPVTKNGVGAWQSLQKQWMQQKRLASAVGKYVRYDDFEVGWDPSFPLAGPRNSHMYMDGLGDPSTEAVVLYGTSLAGTYVTLEDYYDNLNPIEAPSENYLGNVIKTAKFTNKFPDRRTLLMPATFSSMPRDAALLAGGGISTGDIQWLPSDNHLSHMTGSLYYYFKGLPGDVDPGPIADDLKLTITLVYEGWAPLAKLRSSKGTKKISTTAASGKTTTQARRRS